MTDGPQPHAGPVRLDARRERPRLKWLHLLVPAIRYRRHASDVVRVIVTIVLGTVLALAARSGTALETSIGSFLESLPRWLQSASEVLYSVTSTFAVAVLVIAAIVRRRARLVLTIFVSATVAGVALVLLHAWFHPGESPGLAGLRSFPLERLAVVSAILYAVRPFLIRPGRRLVEAFVVLAFFGAVFEPAAMPLDLITAVLLGWGAAAATGLLIGSPDGQSSLEDVRATLLDLGVVATEVTSAGPVGWGDEHYAVTLPTGERLDAMVFGRDSQDAQLLSKLWRAVWYQDSGPSLALSRSHRVAEIGFVMMLARDRGAAVPEVVTAGRGGPSDAAVLLTHAPRGAALADLTANEVSDAALVDLWRSLGALRDARVAHGSIDARHVTVDGDVAEITGFRLASTTAPPVRLDADLAGMLVTQAALVGPERAITTFRSALGDEGVAAVLPMLQPVVLSPELRRIDGLKDLLTALADGLTTKAGVEAPKLTEVHRISLGGLVTLVLGAVGAWFIIGMLADVDWNAIGDALQEATWGWLLIAAIVSVAPAVTDGLASQGGLGTQLPLGGLTMLNIAGKFINVAVPSSIGQAAVNIRFAQKNGVPTGAAISGGMVVGVMGFVVQAVVLITGFALGEIDLDVNFSLSGADLLGVVVIGVVVVSAIGFALAGSRRLRRWFASTVRPQIHEFHAGLSDIASEPRRVLLLLGGNVGSQVLYGAVLYCALQALGVSDASLLLAMLANTAASLLGGLTPVPGGVGVWEGTAIAVLTAGGVDADLATAAVLMHRMLTFYLPPLYGWFGFRWLQRHEYL